MSRALLEKLKKLICIKMDDYENYVSDGVFGIVMIMMMMMITVMMMTMMMMTMIGVVVCAGYGGQWNEGSAHSNPDQLT